MNTNAPGSRGWKDTMQILTELMGEVDSDSVIWTIIPHFNNGQRKTKRAIINEKYWRPIVPSRHGTLNATSEDYRLFWVLYEHSPWDYIADHNKMKTIEIIPTWNWKSIAK